MILYSETQALKKKEEREKKEAEEKERQLRVEQDKKAEEFRKSEVSRLKSSLPDEPAQDKNVGLILINLFACFYRALIDFA